MDNQELIVAEILLKELYNTGVEYVFLVPGAQIVPFVFKLFDKETTGIPKPIIANHELAAGFMALGYARATGKIGVALSIGGPGAAYMVGAGVTAKADDVPMVFITGNIPPENFAVGEFQDASSGGTNDSAIFREAIGTSIVCNRPEELDEVLIKLYKYHAELKPLHIQIPISIQKAPYKRPNIEVVNNFKYPINAPIRNFKDKVKSVILIGQKALDKIDHDKLRNFVKRTNMAVVTDMKTRGILSEEELFSLGYIGFNSDIRALEVFNIESPLAAEHVVCCGVKHHLINQYINSSAVELTYIKPESFDLWVDTFIPNGELIHQRGEWLNEVNEIIPPQPIPTEFKNKVSYADLLYIINHEMPEDTVYCLDAGQIRRAGSIFLTCRSPRTLIQSETLSPMGSGICASVGAQLASTKKRVVSLVGDGSMRMHGMELATAVRYNLPIIFILCDNQSYASVKAQDDAKELPETNWNSYAKLIGIKSFYADNKFDFEDGLKQALLLNEPVLLWTIVPYLLEDELKKTQAVEYKNWLSGI